MNNTNIAVVFTNYIGRYTTRIYIPELGDIYSCDGTELDMKGRIYLLHLKFRGYEIHFDY